MIQLRHGMNSLLVFAVLAAPAMAALADPPPQPPPEPVCREAVVSPVSGHAECVNPRGAPVEQAHRKDMRCARARPDEPVRCPDEPAAPAQNAAPR